MKIASVVGARPNFVKLIPVHKAISTVVDHIIIHTGQHYDYEMSEVFFKEFNLPKPKFELEIGSGTACFQIGEMLKKLDQIFLSSKFNLVIVYGDTNSTFAGALAAEQMLGQATTTHRPGLALVQSHPDRNSPRSLSG